MTAPSSVAVALRPWETVEPRDALSFYLRNRQHLAPWEPLRTESFFTLDHHLEARQLSELERLNGRGYAFAVMSGKRLAGRASLSDVTRGVFQSAYIGYLTDSAMLGRGVATGAVSEVLRIAFEELGLHRVQAAVMPSNAPSQRVLEKMGFTRIGVSPKYLYINGTWEDHVLYAITVEEFAAQRASR